MAQRSVRTLLESGTYFTEENRAKAEQLIKDLVKQGDLRRKDAEESLQALLSRGRDVTEQLLAFIQTEVAKQMSRFTDRVDDVEDRLEDLAQRLGMRRVPRAATKAASTTGTAASRAAGGATTKKSGARKTSAKKASTAKKATAKKTTAVK